MGIFHKRKGVADPEARSPKLGVKNKDLAVMGQLIKHGADLSERREVIFYLYAPDADTAAAMADGAGPRGFEAQVQEPLPQFPGQWSVVCRDRTVLSPEYVRDTVDFFEELARQHQAEYDGWEAAV